MVVTPTYHFPPDNSVGWEQVLHLGRTGWAALSTLHSYLHRLLERIFSLVLEWVSKLCSQSLAAARWSGMCLKVVSITVGAMCLYSCG